MSESAPFFSVITCVNLWNLDRIEKFLRCIGSVQRQTFGDFEWVIVDDGSTEPFLWENSITDSRFRVIHKEHEERVIGYEEGFKQAKGQWITLLDSDDEYVSDYLTILFGIIVGNPEYKMFNFGALYERSNEKVTFDKREPFEPKMLDVGHEVFGGGNIPWGTFIFHRSIYEDLGGFPPKVIKDIDCTEVNYPAFRGQEKPYIRDLHLNTPYDFSAYYQIKYPELRQYFMVDHEAEPDKIIKELGNPWGQDGILFYQYTRKYHSKPIKEYLYIIYPKN